MRWRIGARHNIIRKISGGIKMKKMVWFFVFALFCKVGLYAQTNLFLNINGGWSLAQDPNRGFDVFYKHMGIGLGLGGLISFHLGLESFNNVSIETGADIFINNNIVYNITKDESLKIQFSTIDIPIIAKLSVPISNKFAIQPSFGFYLTFPISDTKIKTSSNEYVFKENHGFISGFQMGIRTAYNLNLKSTFFFFFNIKYDLFPSMAYNLKDDIWIEEIYFRRLSIPIFIGYERKI
jgi:hypothetical protein